MKKILTLFAVVMMACSAWGWNDVYLRGSMPTVGWETGQRIGNGKGGGEFYTNTNDTYKLYINNVGWRGAWGETDYTLALGADKYRVTNYDPGSQNFKYVGPAGIVYFQFDQSTDNHDGDPLIWITRSKLYLKHPWNGGDWGWSVPLVDYQSGEYALVAPYGGVAGANYSTHTKNSDGWGYLQNEDVTVVGSPAVGDLCIFSLSFDNQGQPSLEIRRAYMAMTIVNAYTTEIASQADYALNSDYINISGGTALLHNGKSSAVAMMSTSSNIPNVNLGGSSGSYLKISLTNNQKLKVGDVISIMGINDSKIFKLSSANNNSIVTTDANTGKYTVVGNDNLVGAEELYIWNGGGKLISSVAISRAVEDTPEPVFTWHDISVDLRTYPLGQNAGEKYLAITDDTYNYTDEEPSAYNAHLSSTGWNGTDHGYNNITMTVPVEAGIYKVTFGGCNFGGENRGKLTDAEGNTLNVINENGKTITTIDNKVGCSNTVSVWYEATEAMTIKAIMNNYIPSIAIEKVNSVPEKKNIVTYELGEGVLGQAPDAGIATDTYTLPAKNYTVYKEGYTLIGWNDGTANHNLGETIEVNDDITLTPVFRQNTKTLADRTETITLKWDAQTKNGCPTYNYSGNNQVLYFVTQATINGETIDVAEKVTTASSNGCFRNGSWNDWCQVNGTATFVLPSCKDAIVKFESYNVSVNSTIDGKALTGNTSKTPSATITDDDATVTVEYAADASYFRYMQVTLPYFEPAPVDVPAVDVELDFTEDPYTTSGTIDDQNALSVSREFMSSDSRWGNNRNSTITITVPGPTKIEMGSSYYQGEITVTNSLNGNVDTVPSAVEGNAVHLYSKSDPACAVVYYDGEAATLTIRSTQYLPYAHIKSIAANEIPTKRAVTFYQVDNTTVHSTLNIYDGSSIDILPDNPTPTDGYRFRGWYTGQNGTGTKVTATTKITANMLVYAWQTQIPTLGDDGMYHVTAGDVNSLLLVLDYANSVATDQSPAKVYIPNGTYDLGAICLTEVTGNVHIFGESMERTIIQNTPTAEGIGVTATILLKGENNYLQNLTLKNAYPYDATTGRAVALEDDGDKNICYNVCLDSHQDTYWSRGCKRAYFKGGEIHGCSDAICGSGDVWFEGIHYKVNGSGTLMAPSTSNDTQYGYVFNGCVFEREDGYTENGTNSIARPWTIGARNTLLNCQLTTGTISDAGYAPMATETGEVYFNEYNTTDGNENVITHTWNGYSGTDKGVDYTVTNRGDLAMTSVGNYTYANVVKGSDDWDPEAIIAGYNPSAPEPEAVPVTVTYAYDHIVADGAGVASVSDVFGSMTVNLNGSNIKWGSSSKYGDVNYCGIATQTGNTTNSDYVSFVLTPKSGVTFIPSSISLGAIRNGTDGGTMSVFANSTKLTESTLDKSDVVPGRNKAGSDNNGSYARDGYSFSYNIENNAATVDNPLVIKVCVANMGKDKSFGLANIVIDGTYTTEGEISPDPEEPTPSNTSVFDLVGNGAPTTVGKITISGGSTNNDSYQFTTTEGTLTITAADGYVVTGATITYSASGNDRVGGTPTVSEGYSYDRGNVTGTIDLKTGKYPLQTVNLSFTNKARITYMVVTYALRSDVLGSLSLVAVAGGSKYATFSSTRNVIIPAEDENATYHVYTVSVENGVMSPTDMLDNAEFAVVPAGAGVVIQATAKAEKEVLTLTYIYTEETADDYDASANNLIAISDDGRHVTEDATNYYFKLAYRDNTNKTGLGFYKASGDDFAVKAGGAILGVAISQFASDSPIRGFDFSDWLNPSNPPITTDVEAVNKYVDTKKMLVRGQLVIVRGSKMYDINGRLVK